MSVRAVRFRREAAADLQDGERPHTQQRKGGRGAKSRNAKHAPSRWSFSCPGSCRACLSHVASALGTADGPRATCRRAAGRAGRAARDASPMDGGRDLPCPARWSVGLGHVPRAAAAAGRREAWLWLQHGQGRPVISNSAGSHSTSYKWRVAPTRGMVVGGPHTPQRQNENPLEGVMAPPGRIPYF